MSYPKLDLIIVAECNDEDDNPTCWALLAGSDDRRNHYVWICKYGDDDYRVESSHGWNLANKSFKTLWGAKRCAEGICYRQNESGFYTD